MGFVDLQATYSDQQAIATTAASTNVYDHGAPGTPKHGAAALAVDHGNTEMYLDVSVAETFTASGSATLTITVEQDDAENFSGAETIMTTQAIAKADLVAGAKIKELSRVPLGATKRYTRLKYTVGTGPMTAGAINANLVLGRQTADT